MFSSSEILWEEPPKPGGCLQKRYLFVFLSFAGMAICYSLRVNISVAIVAMVNSTSGNDNTTTSGNQCPRPEVTQNSTMAQGKFNWDEAEQGLILSSFFWGYVLTQIPGGILCQRYGGKWLYGFGILFPAMLTLLIPVAAEAGAWALIAIRILMGLTEGVTFPALTLMLGRWVPLEERSRLGTFAYGGGPFGTVIAMQLSGVLAEDVGWEYVFYVFGGIGILWFFFWATLIHETPEAHLGITVAEKEYILGSLRREQQELVPPTPWLAMLKCVPFLTIIVATIGHTWGFYTLLTELPTYLKNILHFDMRANGFISSLPYTCMWISSIFTSFCADKLISSRIFSVTTVRKIFNSIALYGQAACLIGAAYTGCDRWATVAFLTTAVGLGSGIYSGFLINHIDQSRKFAGAMMGISNTSGTLCGIIAPYVVGYLTSGQQTLERWRLVFFIAAAMYIVTNTIFIIFGSGEEQPFNNIENPKTEYNATEYGTTSRNQENEESYRFREKE